MLPTRFQDEPGRSPAPHGRSRWHACYTYGRHEKRVESRLRDVGIETYLPLRIEHRQWSDRTKRVEFPLFPSYVFARFSPHQLARVLRTAGVATVVQSQGKPTPISDAEIAQVRQLLRVSSEIGVEPEVHTWVERGDRVRVIRGAFHGIEGVVMQFRGRSHVLVRLSAIRRGLAVHVAHDDLQRIA